MSAGNASQDTVNWNQGKRILPASLTSIKTSQTEFTRCLAQSESCLPSREERCFPGKLALLIASYHWSSKVHGEQGPRGRTSTGLHAPASLCWRRKRTVGGGCASLPAKQNSYQVEDSFLCLSNQQALSLFILFLFTGLKKWFCQKYIWKITWKDRKLPQKRSWETESQINQGALCPTEWLQTPAPPFWTPDPGNHTTGVGDGFAFTVKLQEAGQHSAVSLTSFLWPLDIVQPSLAICSCVLRA